MEKFSLQQTERDLMQYFHQFNSTVRQIDVRYRQTDHRNWFVSRKSIADSLEFFFFLSIGKYPIVFADAID